MFTVLTTGLTDLLNVKVLLNDRVNHDFRIKDLDTRKYKLWSSFLQSSVSRQVLKKEPTTDN